VHTRLAFLLRRGTTLAAAVTALGMLSETMNATRWMATATTMCGLLMFALLPVGGLLVTAHHFARGRDWVYLALTTGVLLLVAANVIVGIVA
jgi:uncharacterized membrane protein